MVLSIRNVQRARHLISKGKSGSNDAYVIIQNKNEKFQTSITEQSIDPTWNEECDLLIDDKETDVIKLTLYHRNLFGLADEFLGQALIPLKDYDTYERPKSRWYTLEGKTAKKAAKNRGEIEVRISFIVKSSSSNASKKKTGTHNSLIDIRSALRSSDSSNASSIQSQPNSIDENSDTTTRGAAFGRRKYSMSAVLNNKIPKIANRSFSFKMETINSKRKSMVERIMNKQQNSGSSTGKNNGSSKEKLNETLEKEKSLEKIESICETTTTTTQADKNSNTNTNNNNNDDNSNKINGKRSEKKLNEETTRAHQTKSSSQQIAAAIGPLKRALSSSNVLHLSHINVLPVKSSSRDRSATVTSANFDLTRDNYQFNASQRISRENSGSKENYRQLVLPAVSKFNISRQWQRESRQQLPDISSTLNNNFERRHTIDIDEAIPNLLLSSSNFIIGKRETQTSPDSLYSSTDSLLNRKSSSHKASYQKYESLNKEELIDLIESQQITVCRLNEQINDLEEYIDSLLVRVIENSPRILHNTYRYKTRHRI